MSEPLTREHAEALYDHASHSLGLNGHNALARLRTDHLAAMETIASLRSDVANLTVYWNLNNIRELRAANATLRRDNERMEAVVESCAALCNVMGGDGIPAASKRLRDGTRRVALQRLATLDTE